MAINAYWSPLYSWLAAAVLGIFHPSWRYEYPAIHAMNLVIFLSTMAAFEYFWSGFSRKEYGIPETSLWVLGYSMFLWLTLGLITIVNPDLCVATIVYWIAGLVVRIISGAIDHNFVWLGFALALGYFTKAILFPMAFVFLSVLLLSRVSPRKIVISGLIFVALSAPQLLILSRAKHHVTFSETGTLNLAWSNWNLPYRNWQGQSPGNGIPTHPTRQIFSHPDVFEFGGKIRSSYPPWYDPSYWNEGLRFHFVPIVALRHVAQNSKEIFTYLLQPKAWIVSMLILATLSFPEASFIGIKSRWYLWAPAIACFGLYSLTFAWFRFMSAWFMLVWAAFLFGLRLRTQLPDRTLPWLAGLTATVILVSSANGVRGQFTSVRHDDATPDYRTAEALQKLGIHDGEKVAAVGFDNDVHWAYLTHLFVVAEIGTDQTCEFWSASTDTRRSILLKLKQSGAELVVARAQGGMRSTSSDTIPDLAACAQPDTDWQPLGDGNLAYSLR